MPLEFFNTLTKKKENFLPIKEKQVSLYTCGPTVYDYAHIGNYRSYVFADLLKRTLLYEGFKVKHIMNLTDVDDKTIYNSQKSGKSLKEYTEFYTQEFFKEIKSLNILEPEKFTKATDYIPNMLKMIETLLQKGLAYKSEDGSVYFKIRKFKNYGKLSHLILENQKENASGRIKTDEYKKENVGDFVLWKSWEKSDGEVFWNPSLYLGENTKLGKGRPGWHIECSAMSMETLGEQIDIHTGGVDNIFPHHENEIAQSEGITGKKFVRYWMHNEWVLVNNKKMAKSSKNFFTLKDLEKRKINPIVYRFWLLMANYRTRVNFVWGTLEGADTALKRLYSLYLELNTQSKGEIDKSYQNKFRKCLENDLDTPCAISLLWDLFKDKNITDANKKITILDFDKVLGLGFANIKREKIPEKIKSLLEKRKKARENKNYDKSDEIRKEINSLGYEVKDTKKGQQISKIS